MNPDYRQRNQTKATGIERVLQAILPKLYLVVMVAVIIWIGCIGNTIYTIGTTAINDPVAAGHYISEILKGYKHTVNK